MGSKRVSISGYQVAEQLYDGSKTVVYRAYRDKDRQTVVIKLLKNPYPSFSELLQFRNQYTIAKNLDSSVITQMYSLEPYQNGYALVMEDFGGISLSQWMEGENNRTIGENPQNMKEFLLLAIALCNTLDILIRHRIIHKDIKPANILINPKTKQVKLIDFSIASLLPRETQVLMSPNVLEGTLGYLSPEQTGRMNRGIDYRTDFYSLGVTFYELLTGELPFQSNDPMELVHSHIAKQPPQVHDINPAIAPIISSIVGKLMAKNAEDRYQSAIGLKFDLETCLAQLNKNGKIEDFEIGQRDVSDRFLIPEKLYGREAEVEILLTAFDRVANKNTELMLVAGFSGIGKTAIVNEVHKPIVAARGYFIKGKFDQFNRNIPFSAFVQAFRNLMGQLLSETDTQLEIWKAKILEALGDNGQVIVEVIPELEQIIGQQPPAPELSGMAAQNRFNLLFQKFTQVLTTKEHPLVIFLDDLQWADLASLKLMQLLMSESSTGYLLLIGAYRDNEVSAAHPLILTLEEIGKTNAIINTITLSPLSEESLNQLIADTLSCSATIAQPLTQQIYQKTKGNPFFSTQFLKALYEDGLIQFDFDTGVWQCDIAAVKALALTNDVVEFMALQLQKLPTATQNVLKLAACIGNQFNLATLAVICEQSETEAATVLWKGLQEGLILPQTEVYKFYVGRETQHNIVPEQVVTYKFLHDRVQQAAYSLIPDHQKQAVHLKIGRLLLENIPADQWEEQIFEIVNQINLGRELLTTEAEFWQLAQLNLRAGQKAKLSCAYNAAREYLIIGMEMLPNQAWTKDYSLTFALYRERAEVEYLCSEFDQAESLYPIALANAQTLLDQVTIYLIQMNQYQIQGRYAEAVEVQRTSLSLLGWEMDLEPSSLKNMLDEELQAVADYLVDRNVKDLLYLPHMQDSQKRAMMKILQAMFYAGYLIGNQTLASLTVVKMTTLSLQDGNDEFSPFGYVGYGLVAGGLGNYEIGGQFGEMAVKLSEQFDNNYIKCQTNFLFAADVHNWCRPIQESERYYDNAYRFGLESGDWVTIGYLIIQSGSDRLTSGKDLHDLYEICQAHLAFLKQVKNYDIIDLLHAGVIQPLLHLMGLATFDDEHFSETEYLEKYPNMGYYQAWFYYPKIRSAYWFDERSEWKNLIDKLEIIETYVPSHSKVPETNFYVALMHLALCDTAIESEREHHLQQAQVIEEKLQCWAKSCPENILQKLRLVQAEKARVLGQRLETMDLYDEAIAIATKHKYINNQALANELAAKYYLKIGKEKVAQPYMEEAYSCYTRWGAKAKADDLEKRYLELLAPILQVQQDRSHFNKIRFSTVDSSLVLHQTIQTSITNSSLSEALDFATVLKASQALSSEIQLEHLLCTLMKVVIENAGAKTATLVLLKDRQLFVEAIASTDDGINLISAPLESSETVPITVVNYVKRTLKTIVLHDATVQKDFIGDPYLMQKQPKSVLCAPIVHQGQFMGLLYLENSLTIGVFTNSRLEVIHLLCAQAGISLENARLYQKAQSYGQQLERSLDELKQAQLQLVQNEKMATLGNLVAGVAHEINNPIGFIQGSVTNTEQYIQDLLVHLQLYQQHYPTPVPEIREHAQDIDLEFLTADFQKLINSMKIASRRITAISDSLRTFSRADAVEKVACNIHEGIDSTLLILKYRLKASDKRPAIEVIRDYNELPLVNCFLGQLNQVFMNILANAIDAIDIASAGQTFAELEAKRYQIKISTEVSNDEQTIIVRIGDNGPGMPKSIKDRIFDHLFTTKDVGKGTGIGLAIARQIVEETHAGKLICNSVLGEGTEFVIKLPVLDNSL